MVHSRRMLVLRAVIEDYIRSQEPVGSSALAHHHDLGVSSATIRNDMAALEDEGYLVQPHTSAGRIPTEHGYRYFVDRLSTLVPLTQAQRRGITRFLGGSVSLQDTLQRGARILADITGQVAVISSPSLSKSTLRHVELVPLSASRLLAVVITDTGGVAQHTLTMPEPCTQSDLDDFCSLINADCTGLRLFTAAQRIRTLALDTLSSPRRRLAGALADALTSMADDEQTSDLYMAGTSQLAHQRTIGDLAPLFDALEEQVVLMRLMSTLGEDQGGVGVAIGSETHNPGLIHASVVSSGYGRSPETADETGTDTETGSERQAKGEHADPVAFVGSIGPTHMDYGATMTAVRTVARYLTGLLAQDEDDDGH